jgi:hypothetical protein
MQEKTNKYGQLNEYNAFYSNAACLYTHILLTGLCQGWSIQYFRAFTW